MAEFQKVMRHWKRMCGTYPTCKGCPMEYRGCSSTNADPAVVERETMSWAAEHPEPVYPRWIDWLSDVGLIINTADYYAFNFTAAVDQIPPDIAQKLGIEPKEET